MNGYAIRERLEDEMTKCHSVIHWNFLKNRVKKCNGDSARLIVLMSMWLVSFVVNVRGVLEQGK